VARFRTKKPLEVAIGSHACWFEANIVSNINGSSSRILEF
jgi:hypothetical protein